MELNHCTRNDYLMNTCISGLPVELLKMMDVVEWWSFQHTGNPY
jgi:hypothetical protein